MVRVNLPGARGGRIRGGGQATPAVTLAADARMLGGASPFSTSQVKEVTHPTLEA